MFEKTHTVQAWVLALATVLQPAIIGCGGDGGADFPMGCDASLQLETCGCGEPPCLSLTVLQWRDRTRLDDTAGLAVYLVTADDYEAHENPLAVATPSSLGEVAFRALPAEAEYVVLDDAPDSAADRWAHTGFSIPSGGVFADRLCVLAAALTRSDADSYFVQSGLDPTGGTGLVIFEARGKCNAGISGLEVDVYGSELALAFDEHRVKLTESRTLSEASALLTGKGRYCARQCPDVDCDCSEDGCGAVAKRSGAPGGFFFAWLQCQAP